VWQAWDFARERGLGIVVIGTLIGIQILQTMRGTVSALGTSMVTNIVTTTAVHTVPLFVLLSVSRLISADRAQGYYRILFSKPISIPLFYAQRYVIHLAGVLLCVATLCSLLWTQQIHVDLLKLLAYVATMYVAMGGVAFLLSSITRFDWPVLLGVWYGSSVLYGFFGDRGGIVGALVRVLPPEHAAQPLRAAVINGNPFPASSLTWLLGYGAVCLLLGLLVLWRRPFST